MVGKGRSRSDSLLPNGWRRDGRPNYPVRRFRLAALPAIGGDRALRKISLSPPVFSRLLPPKPYRVIPHSQSRIGVAIFVSVSS